MRLLKVESDPSLLECPTCGCTYTKFSETVTDQAIQSKFGPSSGGTKIVSAKPRRKYYDNFGTLIDDPDIQNLARTGCNVISYHSSQVEEPDKKEVRKRRRKI